MRNSSADYDFRQSGAPSLLRLSYARFSLVGIGRAKAAALRSIPASRTRFTATRSFDRAKSPRSEPFIHRERFVAPRQR